MKFILLRCSCLLLVLCGASGHADVRDHTRMKQGDNTAVTHAQAVDLTLTLSAVVQRPVQIWVRVSGTLDANGSMLHAVLVGADTNLIKIGQRVRAFSLASRSVMHQARITRITPRSGQVMIEAELAAHPQISGSKYLMEIIADQGQFLSIPNEAIIEEGDRLVAYVQQADGEYAPRPITIGIQGELYTQVLSGLAEGEQVVTTGSFFIDADYKMHSN